MSDAEAASNPNLFVSAENPQFDNHFAGSMVVEVVVRDNDIRDTDQGKGEPDVTLNGKTLRMVQATDGNWYAYFANIDKANEADSTVGSPGKGLDLVPFAPYLKLLLQLALILVTLMVFPIHTTVAMAYLIIATML